MNAEETKAAAAVMIAWAEGKPVQYRDTGYPPSSWRDVIPAHIPGQNPTHLAWDFPRNEYRIKPPEPREWLIPETTMQAYGYQPGQANNSNQKLIRVREVES